MKQDLMRYIPKEFKAYVVDIYEGEKEWNEYSQRWNVPIYVEWKSGETGCYQNKGYMRFILKDQHTPEEFAERV